MLLVQKKLFDTYKIKRHYSSFSLFLSVKMENYSITKEKEFCAGPLKKPIIVYFVREGNVNQRKYLLIGSGCRVCFLRIPLGMFFNLHFSVPISSPHFKISPTFTSALSKQTSCDGRVKVTRDRRRKYAAPPICISIKREIFKTM